MNKLIILTAVLTVCMVGVARADMYTFTFDVLANNAPDSAINSYMLGVYGSPVIVSDAQAQINPTDWPTNSTTYLRTGSGANEQDFEILFVTTPISALSGLTRGFVVDEAVNPDFQIFAYDSTYGNVESPAPTALVWSWSGGSVADKTEIDIPYHLFSRPVSLLVISDDGHWDVAIDDLTVQSVPVPAAVLLGLLGLGVAGIKLRKFA